MQRPWISNMPRSQLSTTYELVKKSIVAFALDWVPLDPQNPRPPEFSPIIGTGFVVREDGLIATNHHVLQAFTRIARPPGVPDSAWGVHALLFHMTSAGQLEIPLEVLGAFQIDNFVPGGAYYGPTRPDLAIIHVKARGLPALRLATELPGEGDELATAGFPMGADALLAPGWLHQLTPTLQTGVVSALLPFPCANPHAIVLNVMSQGGASGSPVFSPDTGEVAGVLYGGLLDGGQTRKGDSYRKPTNISYVVPATVLAQFLQNAASEPQLQPPPDAATIEERLANEEAHNALERGHAGLIVRVDAEERPEPQVHPLDRQDDITGSR